MRQQLLPGNLHVCHDMSDRGGGGGGGGREGGGGGRGGGGRRGGGEGGKQCLVKKRPLALQDH